MKRMISLLAVISMMLMMISCLVGCGSDNEEQRRINDQIIAESKENMEELDDLRKQGEEIIEILETMR